jgi:alpha-tubulin suppressor-like RCC1 family protein
MRRTTSRRALARVVIGLATAIVAGACGGGSGGDDSTGPDGPAARAVYEQPTLVASPAAGPFVTVAAGWTHTCAATAAGATYCWGQNDAGQLGVATAVPTCQLAGAPCTSAPLPVQGGRTFTALTASLRHSCALDASGAAACWGGGAAGQLGDGSRTSSSTPLAVAAASPLARLSASLAGGVTCGLTTDGRALCWGQTGEGQLGTGTALVAAYTPVAVNGALRFTAVGVGESHACALTAAGEAYCWGNNWFGQLGVGSAGGAGGLARALTPTRVGGGVAFTALAVGGSHTCALTAAGAAYCWGSGSAVGTASPAPGYTPVPIPVAGGLAFASLTAGAQHTCGLTAAGEAYCWGANVGALGDGTTQDRPAPARVKGGFPFASLSAGGVHTCGITRDGKTYCWGSNRSGAVGQPAP